MLLTFHCIYFFVSELTLPPGPHPLEQATVSHIPRPSATGTYLEHSRDLRSPVEQMNNYDPYRSLPIRNSMKKLSFQSNVTVICNLKSKLEERYPGGVNLKLETF